MTDSLNELLYGRVKKVYDSRESLGLNEQDIRLQNLLTEVLFDRELRSHPT